MSKTSLKKTLNSLTRDQIMEVVLDLYEARKEAREYLEYFISPDERGMAEKTIATISKEFSPTRGKARACNGYKGIGRRPHRRYHGA